MDKENISSNDDLEKISSDFGSISNLMMLGIRETINQGLDELQLLPPSLISHAAAFQQIDNNLNIFSNNDYFEKMSQKKKQKLINQWIEFERVRNFEISKSLKEEGWVISPLILVSQDDWSELFKDLDDISTAIDKMIDFACNTKENNLFCNKKNFYTRNLEKFLIKEIRSLIINENWYSLRLLSLTLIDRKIVEIATENGHPVIKDKDNMAYKIQAFVDLLKDEKSQNILSLFEYKALLTWLNINMKSNGVGKFRNGMCHGNCPEKVSKEESLQALSFLSRLLMIEDDFRKNANLELEDQK